MGRCFIIDDEETYRKQLGLILTAEGHEVQTASTAKEGLESGFHFCPDVLIADWRLLDQVNGLEIAKQLSAANPKLQVIMITGYTTSEMKEEAGINLFQVLEKPFELDDFLDSVRNALNTSHENPLR